MLCTTAVQNVMALSFESATCCLIYLQNKAARVTLVQPTHGDLATGRHCLKYHIDGGAVLRRGPSKHVWQFRFKKRFVD
eukprot:jgi/Botrbrau1/434/Bobra.110_2s0084.1